MNILSSKMRSHPKAFYCDQPKKTGHRGVCFGIRCALSKELLSTQTMADKFYSLPFFNYETWLFSLVPTDVANRIAGSLANSDLCPGLSRGLRRDIEARYFASGIGKIFARNKSAVS